MIVDLPVTGAPDNKTLILGGSRSGKSSLAENMMACHSRVRYIATGYPAGQDTEWAERVAAHQLRRSSKFTTEETIDLVGVLRSSQNPILIDCLGIWMTRILDSLSAWDTPRSVWDAELELQVSEFLNAWTLATVPVCAVSNEVGMGVVPDTASGRLFRDELGKLNMRVAAISDNVIFVIVGIPQILKGSL